MSYAKNSVYIILPALLQAFNEVNLFDDCFKHHCLNCLWNACVNQKLICRREYNIIEEKKNGREEEKEKEKKLKKKN